MTFDEAIEILANSENNKLVKEGQLEYGLYRAYDVVGVLQKLKHEYAPTIEMTKFEKDILSKYKFGDNGDFFDLVEYETDYLYRELSASELMQAWLHPETIKIVDE